MPSDPESWLWLAQARARLGHYEDAVATIRQGLSRLDPSGQFAPPAERLPETAAVRAEQIKRSERAPLLGVLGESLIPSGGRPRRCPPSTRPSMRCRRPWLTATRAAAQAGLQGVPPNLLANPVF